MRSGEAGVGFCGDGGAGESDGESERGGVVHGEREGEPVESRGMVEGAGDSEGEVDEGDFFRGEDRLGGTESCEAV